MTATIPQRAETPKEEALPSLSVKVSTMRIQNGNVVKTHGMAGQYTPDYQQWEIAGRKCLRKQVMSHCQTVSI